MARTLERILATLTSFTPSVYCCTGIPVRRTIETIRSWQASVLTPVAGQVFDLYDLTIFIGPTLPLNCSRSASPKHRESTSSFTRWWPAPSSWRPDMLRSDPYDRHPIDEEDEWGDLQSCRTAAGSS